MLDHDHDPFDDDAPGTTPPGAVADYDPFDDDEPGAAIDFTYYDSLEFISIEPGKRSKFGAIIEAAAQKCPARRSEIVEFIYNEMPALAALDMARLDDTVLSEIVKISDKAVKFSLQEYNEDAKIARAARVEFAAAYRENIIGDDGDLVEVAHSQGLALHEMDARARALGYGWNWSEDKNRIGRRARAGFDGNRAPRSEIITRAQAAAVAPDDTPAAVKPVVVATPAPVKVIAPPREIIKPAPRKFKKLVTMNNAGRVVKDKNTFPDRKIISDPMPARGDYRTSPAADDSAGGVPEMFQEWMAARGKVSYHKGHAATKLPAYLLIKSS